MHSGKLQTIKRLWNGRILCDKFCLQQKIYPLTWNPRICLIKFSLITLLLRTEWRTLTAAYIAWSSSAMARRPRRIAGPPIQFRLMAAGKDWKTRVPIKKARKCQGIKGNMQSNSKCLFSRQKVSTTFWTVCTSQDYSTGKSGVSHFRMAPSVRFAESKVGR